MITDNLTRNRAVMVNINYADRKTYLQYSDDLGATWSTVYSQLNQAASTISTNGSNLYMIPTSTGTVLLSSNASSWSNQRVSALSNDPRLTGTAYKPGTSTWWVGGTLSNAGVRTVYVFKTTDDGQTWDAGTPITTNGFTDRGSNRVPYVFPYSWQSNIDPYTEGGVALTYKNGVLLLGGNQVLRSTDDGANWSAVSTGLVEVAQFSVEHDTVWLAAGSSLYTSFCNTSYTADARTLMMTTDFGETWMPTSGDFNLNAYSVKYGNGAWLASGIAYTPGSYLGVIRASFDGYTWATLPTLPTINYGTIALSAVIAPGYYNDIGFDGTTWKLFYMLTDDDVTLYSHSSLTPLTSGWTSTPLTTISNTGLSRLTSYVAQDVDPGADITTITFPLPNTGPIFTSPAQTTFVLWQYMPIPDLTFLAPGATAYFISPLPTGLSWNPITHTITGACVDLGRQSFTVYAQNSGLTALDIILIVEVPRIIKQQTGAGAYTSLLRQYTQVNAAQKARDTRAFPTQVSGIGEFASPYPPAVITPSNCPC
jgi:hypothetical protein